MTVMLHLLDFSSNLGGKAVLSQTGWARSGLRCTGMYNMPILAVSDDLDDTQPDLVDRDTTISPPKSASLEVSKLVLDVTTKTKSVKQPMSTDSDIVGIKEPWYLPTT